MPRASSSGRIITRKGRVVYERKPHIFDEKDLNRILNATQFVRNDPNILIKLLRGMTTKMIEIMLTTIGLSEFADETYELINLLISRGLEAILSNPARLKPDNIVRITRTYDDWRGLH